MITDACLDIKQAHNTAVYVTISSHSAQVELRLSHRNDLRIFLSVEALREIVAFAGEQGLVEGV